MRPLGVSFGISRVTTGSLHADSHASTTPVVRLTAIDVRPQLWGRPCIRADAAHRTFDSRHHSDEHAFHPEGRTGARAFRTIRRQRHVECVRRGMGVANTGGGPVRQAPNHLARSRNRCARHHQLPITIVTGAPRNRLTGWRNGNDNRLIRRHTSTRRATTQPSYSPHTGCNRVYDATSDVTGYPRDCAAR
jgi:hypothetical protein